MSTRLAKRLVSPDYDKHPEYVVTYGPEVASVNAAAGFAPDPQQEHALNHIFAVRPDGTPAAFEFACVVCRQNLKTGLFKQAVIGWLYVLDLPLCVWSSHEMSTTHQAHRELANTIRDSVALSKRLMTGPNNGIYDANGQERIELATGQQLLFKARTVSGGRGLAAPGLVLDEAFALTASMMGSLIPLMMAQAGWAQVLYGSSAGKASSDVLFDIRERGRAGSSPRLAYLEWLAKRRPCRDEDCLHPKSGADGCALDDVELLAQANPTLTTGRITLDTIAAIRQALPPAEFMRECLGWWDEPEEYRRPAVDFEAWVALKNRLARAPTATCVAVDVTPDQKRGCIAVAGRGSDGKTLVMVTTGRGTEWIVPKVASLEGVIEVAVAPATKAGALIPDLAAAGMVVHSMSPQQSAQACASWQSAVKHGTLEHVGQAELDSAVMSGRTVMRGEAEQWERNADSPPLIAASVAAFRWAANKSSDYNLLDSVW